MFLSPTDKQRNQTAVNQAMIHNDAMCIYFATWTYFKNSLSVYDVDFVFYATNNGSVNTQ